MGLFDWFKSSTSEDQENVLKRPLRRPVDTDMSYEYVVNRELTSGLYHNTYPGLKLAGGLAFPAIALPVYFMGIPSFKCEKEQYQDYVDLIAKQHLTDMQKLHTETHREGTLWVFPYYNSRTKKVEWKWIHDDIVTDILSDIDTGMIKEIYTDEQIKYKIDYNETKTTRIIVRYQDKFITKKSGTESQVKRSRNVIGILPVNFTNNADTNSSRGHSDFERTIPLFKSYHDISYNSLKNLAKFSPKWVQKVSKPSTWKSNNGISDDYSNFNIQEIDIILNTDQEESEFLTESGINSEAREERKMIFHQMVESSGIPEIFWGLKTTGNHASAEEQMTVGILYVKDKRRQKDEKYKKLMQASLKSYLLSIGVNDEPGDIEVNWDVLDSTSDKTKSEVFKNFADGASRLRESASITDDQLLKMFNSLYPGSYTEDLEQFRKDLIEVARLNQFNKASYESVLGMSGEDNGDSMTPS